MLEWDERRRRASAIYLCRIGTPIRLPGVGRIRASLDREGAFRVNVVPDPSLVRALNAPGTYTVSIVNAGNISLANAAYKAFWDAQHPDDPRELAS